MRGHVGLVRRVVGFEVLRWVERERLGLLQMPEKMTGSGLRPTGHPDR